MLTLIRSCGCWYGLYMHPDKQELEEGGQNRGQLQRPRTAGRWTETYYACTTEVDGSKDLKFARDNKGVVCTLKSCCSPRPNNDAPTVTAAVVTRALAYRSGSASSTFIENKLSLDKLSLAGVAGNRCTP